MNVDDVLELVGKDRDVAESYVLVRELKLYLNVGHAQFHPRLGVKIYRSGLQGSEIYSFDVSHHVHGPEQMGPYYPSRTSGPTEVEVISDAISTTTSFIKSAIDAGHEPSDKWLIKNEDF